MLFVFLFLIFLFLVPFHRFISDYGFFSVGACVDIGEVFFEHFVFRLRSAFVVIVKFEALWDIFENRCKFCKIVRCTTFKVIPVL